jgi:putative flippase GtrA
VQTLSLYVWVDRLGLRDWYLGGLVVGFCIALAITFTLQKYWTFRDTAHERAPRQFVWYTGIALMSLGLNALLLALAKVMLDSLGIDFFHLWYLGAQIVITGCVATASFLMNRLTTFKDV